MSRTRYQQLGYLAAVSIGVAVAVAILGTVGVTIAVLANGAP